MEITDRFGQLWHDWDESVRSHRDIPEFLSKATDQDLVELLAGESSRNRKYERDVLATEILNRLGRRHRDLPAAADEVLRSAEAAYQAATEGQRAIHTAEGILKAKGDEALGAEVSASAYASLDTTKLAFEAAQQNSADVQAAVSQSRTAHEFAKDAARTAHDGAAATHGAAQTLKDHGHSEAAREAGEAADEISAAADAVVAAVAKERAAEGDST